MTSTWHLTVILVLGLAPRTIAQVHVPGSDAIPPPKSPLESELRQDIGCLCGTCAHEPLTTCTCGTADAMRHDLSAAVAANRGRDEVIQALTLVYGGQHFLRAPLNSGIGRLAWGLPYACGLVGIGLIGLATKRWTRQVSLGEPIAVTPEELRRIDDELLELE
jgi:cytochrome c-type biogenesis protein CcmH/NrfF